jgi:pyruvate/oxaloacetate carboxyltransferase
VRRHYWKYESSLHGIDAGVLAHQIPGGMISNLVGQLREQGAQDRWPEVVKENAAVRADLGFPPLVTPSSQIVGTQAVFNVLTGQRYGTVTRETRNLVKGLYGQTPAPIDAELQEQILGDEEPIDYRPADDLAPEMETTTQEIGDLATSVEDVLSYVMHPMPARQMLQWRKEGGGPERELVAAVIGALYAREQPAAVAALTGSAQAVGQVAGTWKTFGRMRQMR